MFLFFSRIGKSPELDLRREKILSNRESSVISEAFHLP